MKTEDSDGEWARYQAAREASIEQLGELYDKACREVGEANAAIFEIHQMMLEDDDYNESVENIIRTQQVNAEYAVAATGDNFSQMFAAMDDDYMRGRAADVKDISERVLNNLSGAGKTGVTMDELLSFWQMIWHRQRRYSLTRIRCFPLLLYTVQQIPTLQF